MNRLITLKEYFPNTKLYQSWLEKIPVDIKKHILYKFLNYNELLFLNKCENFARKIVTCEELSFAKKYQKSVIKEENYYFNLPYDNPEKDFCITSFNTNFEFEELERERIEELELERIEELERERIEELELERIEKEYEEILEKEYEERQEEERQEEEEKMLELERQEEEKFFEPENDYEYYDYLDKKYMERIEGVMK